MAYVSTEQTKRVKQELEAKFSKKDGWKFSVSREHYSTVKVAIMTAPIDLLEGADDYEQKRQHRNFNNFWLDQYKHSQVLKEIRDIADKGNYDRSDSMSDYFDVGFYLDISAGKWNVPFKLANA